MSAALLVGVVVTTALGLGVVGADPITLPRTKVVLDLPGTWTKLDHANLVAAYRSPEGLALAVTRAQVPNPDAWRPKTRDTYADQIERGAIAAVAGQRRIGRKLGEANGVPALDLELRRADGTTVVLRVLLFRTYALALAIEIPKGKSLDEARSITTRFAPPKP